MTKKIYVLRDPRTNKIRYVGQTSDPEARLHAHIRVGQMNPYKEWIIGLVSAGFEPEMEVIATVEDDLEADELELLKIEQFHDSDEVELVNSANPRSTASKWHLVKDLKPNRVYVASEIADIAGVQQMTALKYLRRLAEKPGWKCIDQKAPHTTILLPTDWDIEFPDNISVRNWLNLLHAIEDREALTADIIIDLIGVSHMTARKYMRLLKGMGWREYDGNENLDKYGNKAITYDTGGRPPKIIIKEK